MDIEADIEGTMVLFKGYVGRYEGFRIVTNGACVSFSYVSDPYQWPDPRPVKPNPEWCEPWISKSRPN